MSEIFKESLQLNNKKTTIFLMGKRWKRHVTEEIFKWPRTT